MSVVEQRYHAVMEVLAGAPVTEVAFRYGVSRQSVHTWMRRYREGGLGALADRSHRVRSHPMQTPAQIEVLICELRRAHPKWGPRTLVWELGRRGVEPLPSRSSVYRALVRNGLIDPMARKRKRSEFVRWERPGPMQLWQMDIMGGVFLADGTECKLITGIDDHARFCVIASVVVRATGRAVCAAFASAMQTFGVPQEVLTDNGKQFTCRFGGPRAGETLFERICRENGITARNTQPRTPTTTGKIERFHQTVRRELLDQAAPFVSIQHAQAAVDEFVTRYNTARPHQALDMAFPVDRFTAPRADHDQYQQLEAQLALRLPAGLAALDGQASSVTIAPEPDSAAGQVPALVERTPLPASVEAVEVDRIVPDSGNLSVAGQQVWLGPDRAGMSITLWISTAHLHVLTACGDRLKTVPSRLTSRDLTTLPATADARPAGPAPIPALDAGYPAVEIDRLVSTAGTVSLANHALCIGTTLAGQRVTIRMDGITAQVLDGERTLLRTVRCPLPITECGRLRGARTAGPPPKPPTGPVTVQRVVSIKGGIMVVGQKINLGRVHARKVVTVTVDDSHIAIHDEAETLKVVTRTTTQEVSRIKSADHTKPRKIV
ncbi:IS481 family transposase [Sphaerisporangium sp. NPDC049002]|uniref:IS481 family transposase n=1 Tax=Sphaerisporangium sp. NPDC049002 TaxID=3155392 RepID=UPI0033F0F5A1